jgi:predicted phosphoadenosine phosphosulfate sulfurtransferase
MEWRERFLQMGAGFDWYCLEVRHYSCLNQLQNDESFICWDRYKQASWIRHPPPFALRSHPFLRPRQDTYQDFLKRLNDRQNMNGVRVYESVQRRLNFAGRVRVEAPIRQNNVVQPIYDWHDSDVWLYVHEHGIQVPDAYMFMWQIGTTKPRLRISQFFSVDTIGFLAQIAEYYPDLMRRICEREPNAYLVSLYYDSEMFRRRTRTRKELEGNTDAARDYKGAVFALLSNIPANFHTKHQRKVAKDYRTRVIRLSYALEENDYRRMYDSLIAGDPKNRTLRAIEHSVRRRYAHAEDHADA